MWAHNKAEDWLAASCSNSVHSMLPCQLSLNAQPTGLELGILAAPPDKQSRHFLQCARHVYQGGPPLIVTRLVLLCLS